MKRCIAWVGSWLLATALAAQQNPPDPAPARPASPAGRLAALQAEQKQMVEAWIASSREAQAKAKEAKETGAPIPAMPMRPDFSPLLATAKAAAADYAGTDDAVPFLLFVVQNGAGTQRQAVAEALDTLTASHLDHQALAELGPMIPALPRLLPKDKATLICERLEKSSNPDVKAAALLARHADTIEKAPVDGDAYKTAKSELLAAAGAAADQRLQGEIRGAIDTREKFGVGNVAPDIEGVDLDGVSFKLSDYKGKVVFLDFWGDW